MAYKHNMRVSKSFKTQTKAAWSVPKPKSRANKEIELADNELWLLKCLSSASNEAWSTSSRMMLYNSNGPIDVTMRNSIAVPNSSWTIFYQTLLLFRWLLNNGKSMQYRFDMLIKREQFVGDHYHSKVKASHRFILVCFCWHQGKGKFPFVIAVNFSIILPVWRPNDSQRHFKKYNLKSLFVHKELPKALTVYLRSVQEEKAVEGLRFSVTNFQILTLSSIS